MNEWADVEQRALLFMQMAARIGQGTGESAIETMRRARDLERHAVEWMKKMGPVFSPKAESQ